MAEFQVSPHSFVALDTVGILNPILKCFWSLKGWATAKLIAMVPPNWKPEHSKSRCFSPNFKWFLWPFIWILNDSGFQIPFEIRDLRLPLLFVGSLSLNTYLTKITKQKNYQVAIDFWSGLKATRTWSFRRIVRRKLRISRQVQMFT